jgi:uncharacterized protein YdiU (UPF0061 family)
MTGSVDTLPFGARFAASLPGDPSADPWPREVRGAAWSPVKPTPVRAPRLLAWADEVGAMLGVARPEPVGPAVEVLAGNRLPPGARPFAACYGGHQFGVWAGQLGDGRAIVLGDVTGPGGRLEVQLKGAGPTPYSRTADGRAVLRSSIREFLCSEAMFHLGVPTTRALSLVATGEPVVRDMFYDGNAEAEPGAIVARVAPSFVRFGNFELPASRRDVDLLRALADPVIADPFPELGPPSPDTYVAWFAEVSRRTAALTAKWMALGFVHGVMNTDNLSILGLTIDYGPYGWLDAFDPNFTPNTTDYREGRYRWRQQGAVGHWNVARLGRALGPLMGDTGVLRLEAEVDAFPAHFAEAWRTELSAKLGFSVGAGDDPLLAELFSTMAAAETDWTILFRRLADVPTAGDRLAPILDAFYAPPDDALRARWQAWLAAYTVRAAATDADTRRATMNAANPWVLPRNWVVQEVIDAATAGDAAPIERLLDVLRRPYTEQPEAARIAGRRPEWARNKAGCSALSCSS